MSDWEKVVEEQAHDALEQVAGRKLTKKEAKAVFRQLAADDARKETEAAISLLESKGYVISAPRRRRK